MKACGGWGGRLGREPALPSSPEQTSSERLLWHGPKSQSWVLPPPDAHRLLGVPGRETPAHKAWALVSSRTGWPQGGFLKKHGRVGLKDRHSMKGQVR